jgi:hypothetical protein
MDSDGDHQTVVVRPGEAFSSLSASGRYRMRLHKAALELLTFLAVFGGLLVSSYLLWRDGLGAIFLALVAGLLAERAMGWWLERHHD